MSSVTRYIGAHVSAQGGVQNTIPNAREIGANAFALFTRNQRRWNSKPYDQETIDAFRQAMGEAGFAARHVLPHAGYLINVGSPDEEVRTKSIDALAEELTRCAQLDLTMLNVHPGTSKGELDVDATCRRIADGIDRAFDLVEDSRDEPVLLVLENTAGQGSSIGRTFEELAAIIDAAKMGDRLRVCVDTCHAFAAGFDIRTADGWNAMMDDLDRAVGLSRLVGLHLNDSVGELGTTKDRHAHIGEGRIGLDAFRALVTDTRLADLPMILETPDPDRWHTEIELLRSFASR